MTERRVLAIIAATGAAAVAGGGVFTAAGSQSIDWTSPVGFGTIGMAYGAAAAAFVGAYKGLLREPAVVGGT